LGHLEVEGREGNLWQDQCQRMHLKVPDDLFERHRPEGCKEFGLISGFIGPRPVKRLVTQGRAGVELVEQYFVASGLVHYGLYHLVIVRRTSASVFRSQGAWASNHDLCRRAHGLCAQPALTEMRMCTSDHGQISGILRLESFEGVAVHATRG
jgi:hypothetical protein